MSKINSGTIVLGFLAILFGLIGTWAIREYSKQPSVTAPDPVSAPAKVVVPMASRTLEPGHQIKIDDIALVKLSREQIKEHGFDKGFMSNAAQILGKTVKSEIQRGKTFDTREFFPDGTGPGIADRLKPGQRAVTVSLTPTNALIGFAGAGQIVDVLFHYGEKRKAASEDNDSQTSTAGRQTEQTRFYQSATVTLVQSAEILALGNRAVPTENANGISTQGRVLVTLAVGPTDAEAIRVADGNGELSLSLRNPLDQTTVELGAPKLLSEIIQVDPGVRHMEIYRGKQLSRLEFKTHRGASPRVVVGQPDPGGPHKQEPANNQLDDRELRRLDPGNLKESTIGSANQTRSLLDSRRSSRASTQFGVRR